MTASPAPISTNRHSACRQAPKAIRAIPDPPERPGPNNLMMANIAADGTVVRSSPVGIGSSQIGPCSTTPGNTDCGPGFYEIDWGKDVSACYPTTSNGGPMTGASVTPVLVQAFTGSFADLLFNGGSPGGTPKVTTVFTVPKSDIGGPEDSPFTIVLAC